MTVGELVEILKKGNQDALVFIEHKGKRRLLAEATESEFSPSERIKSLPAIVLS